MGQSSLARSATRDPPPHGRRAGTVNFLGTPLSAETKTRLVEPSGAGLLHADRAGYSDISGGVRADGLDEVQFDLQRALIGLPGCLPGEAERQRIRLISYWPQVPRVISDQRTCAVTMDNVQADPREGQESCWWWPSTGQGRTPAHRHLGRHPFVPGARGAAHRHGLHSWRLPFRQQARRPPPAIVARQLGAADAGGFGISRQRPGHHLSLALPLDHSSWKATAPTSAALQGARNGGRQQTCKVLVQHEVQLAGGLNDRRD